MIRLKYLTILLLLPVLAIAENVTISGNLSNCDVKKIKLSIERIFITNENILSDIKVKSNEFSHSFEIKRNRIVNLTSEEFNVSLYIEPGDDLHIEFNAEIDDKYTFTGSAAANNKIYTRFRSKFRDKYNLDLIKQQIKTTSFDPYEIQSYNDRREQKKMIVEHPAYVSASKDFKNFLDHTLRYQYYNQLLAYPIVRGNSNRDIKVVALPRVIVDEIEGLEANNNEAIISNAYRNFLLYYSTYFTSKNNDYQKYTDYNISLVHKTEYVNSHLIDEAQYYMIAKFTHDICEKANASLVNKNYQQLNKHIKYQQYAKAINLKCGDVMRNTAKAVPVKITKQSQTKKEGINFSFKGMDGNTINLSDFVGKVVYVDFWASWCGPCRIQFPYSHKLQNRFTDKQKKSLVFLYISIDASEERWKSAVRSNKLNGVQGISPGNWNSEVVKKFGVSSIPRYMIIGKDGKLVQSKSQPPSSPTVYDTLINLISK